MISIHTPTQGATVGPVVYFRNNTGFQSTLPRKERRIKCPKMSATGIFQSTLPRKERLYSPHDQETSKHISIHAPTQGATRIPHRGHIFYPYFNPRSHARSDSCRIKFLVIHCVFQSTLPRKERPGGTYDPAVVKNFNPRSHARSDVVG